MKKILLTAVVIANLIFGAHIANAQQANNFWLLVGTTLQPTVNSWNVKIPNLASTGNPCLTISSTGTFATTSCAIGGFATTTIDYWLTTKSTSNLVEGSNLYYTVNRVASLIAGTTTTALAEGTNLYFTNSRADGRAVAVLAGTTSLPNITTLAGLSLPLTQTTGTLPVTKGGTGQTAFGQGWLNSNGTVISASTSPTVNYVVATSTTGTSTLPNTNITRLQIGTDIVTDLTGANLSIVNGALTASGGGGSLGSATSTDPLMVARIVATSTVATSTLPNISTTRVQMGADLISDFTGTGLVIRNGALSASTTLDNMFINVTNYGVVGDGVVDDNAAFQAAYSVQQNASSTACLFVPSIQVNISQTLDGTNKGCVMGIYGSSNFQKANVDKFASRIIMTTDNTPIFKFQTDGDQLDGIVLKYKNRQGLSDTEAKAIWLLSGAVNWRFRNLAFQDVGHAFYSNGGEAWNGDIQNVHISGYSQSCMTHISSATPISISQFYCQNSELPVQNSTQINGISKVDDLITFTTLSDPSNKYALGQMLTAVNFGPSIINTLYPLVSTTTSTIVVRATSTDPLPTITDAVGNILIAGGLANGPAMRLQGMFDIRALDIEQTRLLSDSAVEVLGGTVNIGLVHMEGLYGLGSEMSYFKTIGGSNLNIGTFQFINMGCLLSQTCYVAYNGDTKAKIKIEAIVTRDYSQEYSNGLRFGKVAGADDVILGSYNVINSNRGGSNPTPASFQNASRPLYGRFDMSVINGTASTTALILGNSLSIGTTSQIGLLNMSTSTGNPFINFCRTASNTCLRISHAGAVNNFTSSVGYNFTNSEADGVNKSQAITFGHYDQVTQQSMCFGIGSSGATTNTLNIGGGTGSNCKAATTLSLFTALNSTTTIGTERLRITSAGFVGIGTTSPYAKLSVVGEVVAEEFTATSTTATSTFPNLATNAILLGGEYVTDLTGSGLSIVNGALTAAGGSGWATTSSDYWESTKNRWSTTSTDFWESTQSRWATTSAQYFLSQNQGSAFSTTSVNFWETTQNRWATTSAAFFLSQNQGSAFSSTSADAWENTKSRWATTSADFWESTQTRWATTSDNFAFDTRLSATTTLNNLTTLQGLTDILSTRATTTNATSTNLFATNASSTNLYTSRISVATTSQRAAITVQVTGAQEGLYIGRSGTPNGLGISFEAGRTNMKSPSGFFNLTNAFSSNQVKQGLITVGTYDDGTYPPRCFGGALDNGVFGPVNIGGGFIECLAATSIEFYASDNASSTVGNLAMRILGGGNVGIGVLVPTDKLVVSGTTTALRFNATSTVATSTFPNVDITRLQIGSDVVTDLTGSGISIVNGALTSSGGSGFSTTSADFWETTQNRWSTTSSDYWLTTKDTDNIAEGSNLYWTNNRFDTRLAATTSLPNIATLDGLSLPITQTTGTLSVARGGTGQTSFGQGLLTSNGTTISASSSPTVASINATSTTVTNTFAGSLQVNNGTLFVDAINEKVGIGSTSPAALLTIANNLNTPVGTDLLLIASSTNGTATTTLFEVGASGNISIGTSTNNLSFINIANNVNQPTFFIDGARNGSDLFRFVRSAANGGTGNFGLAMKIQLSNPSVIFRSGMSASTEGTSVNSITHLSASNSLVIATTTNVGGTFPGQEPFYITNANANIGLAGTTTPWGSVSINGIYQSANEPTFVVGSSTKTDLIVTQGGFVGVGTTSPWRTFSTNGTVAMNGLTVSAGTPSSICQNATTREVTVNAATSCVVSDEDQKTPLAPLKLDALELVRKIQPVSFYYKDNLNRLRYGFGAQSLQKIDNQLGDGFDEEGIARSIDIPALISINTAAIKELDEMITGKIATAKKSAQDNWQWIVIGLLSIGFCYQQYQIIKLKK